MKFETRSSTRRQTLALLLSPVVWMTYFMLIYLLDEAACGLHLLTFQVWPGVMAVILIMLLLSLLTLGVIGYSGYLSWQVWRQAEAGREAADSGPDQEATFISDIFVGTSGVMLSGLFALLTLVVMVGVVVLRPC